ncbi:MAG: succinate dehydrogenase, cytochrome b556 subunit [Ramlibacter sp.]|nr:succinate dehydrogenase, cytochrome b556 subunit [Ramlibacter sp.]
MPPRAPVTTAPRFLDLRKIRFPVGALASIGHRVSGVLLLVCLPLLAWALERSLRSPADYDALAALLRSPWVALPAILPLWALAHHLLAGIRHLLMDIGVGATLSQARASARLVIALAFAVAALALIGWIA